MKSHSRTKEKGQALIELAVFGSIILIVFGILLSFIQQFNNQQYAAMETFRRALEKANTYQGKTSEGAGASVQFIMSQNRRQADLSGGFRKGASTSVGSSANIFWAVPKVGNNPESLVVMRINEDQKVARYRDYVSDKDDEKKSFRTEDMETTSESSFNEAVSKQESPTAIATTKSSRAKDTLHTIIPYTIRKKEAEDDYDDSNDQILQEGTFWDLTQGLYLDTDGQYKYRSDKVDTEVERVKTWETEF
ncbi:MAG: hypothetical protein V1925_05230 [Candidatus Omnitrophota bacterium]